MSNQTVDTSDEAVAARVTFARQIAANMRTASGSTMLVFADSNADAIASFADLLSALHARAIAAERERDEAKDAGVDFVLEYLGKLFKVESWTQCDGTDDWGNDVRGTVCNILQAAKVIDEETGETAMGQRDATVAEVAALRNALTPSSDTKADYIGEFKFPMIFYDEDGDECIKPVTVPWTTIKEIMARILAHAAPPKETAK